MRVTIHHAAAVVRDAAAVCRERWMAGAAIRSCCGAGCCGGAAAPERLVHSSVETGVALCCCVGRQRSVLTVMNNLRGDASHGSVAVTGTSCTRVIWRWGHAAER
jgi:hypothetical protein